MAVRAVESPEILVWEALSSKSLTYWCGSCHTCQPSSDDPAICTWALETNITNVVSSKNANFNEEKIAIIALNVKKWTNYCKNVTMCSVNSHTDLQDQIVYTVVV